TNNGTNEWLRETGQLSIWMLGMFIPSPSVVVVIPFNQGDEKVMGPPVNDNYFGKIASDRLKVEGDHIFFRCDGKSRGKLGLPPLRAKGIMGSYDSANNILTLLICKQPQGITDYVNSAWQLQEDPYSGDALNSYNDGPLEDGSQMGPFYELETSSPAAALKPNETAIYNQTTIHFEGTEEELNAICQQVFGISLEEVKAVCELHRESSCFSVFLTKKKCHKITKTQNNAKTKIVKFSNQYRRIGRTNKTATVGSFNYRSNQQRAFESWRCFAISKSIQPGKWFFARY